MDILKNDEEIGKIFKAFCDENRVKILKLLRVGKKCNCEISEILNLPQSKLSYHMKILCESKIVEASYVGKWTHYEINKSGCETAKNILNVLLEIKPNTESIHDECYEK